MAYNNQDTPLGLVEAWIKTDKFGGLGTVLSGSSAFFRVVGFDELTFLLKSSALPLLKSGVIEYSTPMGDKTSAPSINQTLNDISFTLIERDLLTAKNAIECIQTSGINGSLMLEFYVGNSQFIKPQIWGYGQGGTLKIEDGIEIDNESTESPMTISGTFSCHYFPPSIPTPNLNVRAATANLLQDVINNEGKGVEC
jgi:hypothetical protein